MRSGGVRPSTSRVTDVTIGIIMMARTTPAVKGLPMKFPLLSNSGIQPRYLLRSVAHSVDVGCRMYSAHRPMITEGMAAMRSMRFVRIFDTGLGARNTRNTESSNDTGTAMTSATTDSSREPHSMPAMP